MARQPVEVQREPIRIVEMERDERADEREAAVDQRRPNLGGGSQVAGRAELRPRVADVPHRIERLDRAGHPFVVVHDLVDPERDRRRRDPDPRRRRGGRHVVTNGKRGSGAIAGHSVLTQARSGSSVLAIVRRSPARAFRK